MDQTIEMTQTETGEDLTRDTTSRRTLLRLLGGGALMAAAGGLGVREVADAKKRHRKGHRRHKPVATAPTPGGLQPAPTSGIEGLQNAPPLPF